MIYFACKKYSKGMKKMKIELVGSCTKDELETTIYFLLLLFFGIVIHISFIDDFDFKTQTISCLKNIQLS